jgi:hypothetical protein
MLRAALTAALAAAVLGGCSTVEGEGASGTLADIREFFGASDPFRHARLLESHHDRKTFRHEPDLPDAWESCLGEIGVLAESAYANWRERGVAILVLSRVATADPGALHRAAAVRALRTIGTPVLAAEDPPSVPGPESEVAAAVRRLPLLHAPEDGTHLGAEARADCARVLRVLGDLRPTPPASQTREESLQTLRVLQGTLYAVLGETRSALAHADGDVQGEADRAIVNLAAQAAFRSFAYAAIHDADARVRTEAYGALGGLRAGEGVPILALAFRAERVATARAPLVACVADACAADSGAGRAAGVPVLIAALEDPASTVRFHGHRGLVALAGEDLGGSRAAWIRWWSREKPGP